MLVITWNMQWGRGVDGRVDLPRIVAVARALGDFDVLCLQEVADNYPGLEALAPGVDQFAQLAGLLPGYHAVDGVATERHAPGLGRQRFGNMVFTRQPPLQVLRHQLPSPPDPANHGMPRLALEVVVDTPIGPLRVTTTHLEYYSAVQRRAQVEALRELQRTAAAHPFPGLPGQEGTPFEPRPRGPHAVLTGDFNCDAADPVVARLQEPIDGVPRWVDAWTLAHPGRPHPPTLGLHDRAQWKGFTGSFDFLFVSEDLAGSVRRVEADLQTQASDHQPVLLELDCSL
jgi:endonuclease/exonuclease/phosphatase family metal-dependent hydrolase